MYDLRQYLIQSKQPVPDQLERHEAAMQKPGSEQTKQQKRDMAQINQ